MKTFLQRDALQHREVDLRAKSRVQVAELTVLIRRDAALEIDRGAILGPQQLQRHARLAKLVMHPGHVDRRSPRRLVLAGVDWNRIRINALSPEKLARVQRRSDVLRARRMATATKASAGKLGRNDNCLWQRTQVQEVLHFGEALAVCYANPRSARDTAREFQ
jgi:hypothetical protein